MQCRDIAEVLEQEGLSPLPDAARAHVARCSHCQDYIADLETIVSAAREWPTEVEPPPRVWMALRAQLEQRSEEHTSELQSRLHLVCRLLLEKKKNLSLNKFRYPLLLPTHHTPQTHVMQR